MFCNFRELYTAVCATKGESGINMKSCRLSFIIEVSNEISICEDWREKELV